MTESSKKRKRSTNDQHNQTIANRGVINANWQQFLSSNLIMDKTADKPAKNSNKSIYTGTFRRARNKKNITSNSVENVKESTETTTDELANVNNNRPAKKERKKNQITKFLAMDCEMVGIGYEGNDHMLARVSVVNKFGDCVYDKFVKAREEVVDYRTKISGIRREDLLNAEDFSTVQKEIAELIRGKILVGHSLKNDLSVLFLSHPKRSIRDTSRYKPFRKVSSAYIQ